MGKGSTGEIPADPVLSRIESKLDALIHLHADVDPLPAELVITPADLAGASQAQLWDWIRALNVPLPREVLRTAVQRHLQRHGQVVEREPKPPPPPPPWEPERGLRVRELGGKKKGKLGISKSGAFIVRWRDETKSRFKTPEALYSVVEPYKRLDKTKSKKKKKRTRRTAK